MIILKLLVAIWSLADFLLAVSLAFALMPFNMFAELLTEHVREMALI
jgi:hypothetical protein